jgi:predicted PurR-regulated permease PerM
VVYVLWRARGALLPFAFACLIAYLLAPAVALLQRQRLPPWLCVLIVYAALALLVTAVVAEVAPALATEGRHLVKSYPRYASAAERSVGSLWQTYHGLALPAPVRAETDRILAQSGGAVRTSVRTLIAGLAHGLPILASFLLSPFLAYYILRDRERLAAAFWHQIPQDRHGRVAVLLIDLDRAVGGFLRGQLLVALAVGLMALVVTLLFGLPFPLFVALVAAVTDLIPYVGPLLGALPAVAFALLRSPLEALWVLIAFLAIHQLEGIVLSPNLVGAQVGLHPLVVIGALLIGGDLFGLPGVLLAVPALAAARLLVRFGLDELRRWSRQARRRPSLPKARLRPRVRLSPTSRLR